MIEGSCTRPASRNRQLEALTAETITNLNPLTPLPIFRLFRPAGTLDALANCTNLTSVDVSKTYLGGQSYARSRKRLHLHLMDEATSGSCTDALTPKSCCAPPPPSSGSLAALANCTKLTSLNMQYCRSLTGTSSL